MSEQVGAQAVGAGAIVSGGSLLGALLHAGLPLRKAVSVLGAILDVYRPGMTADQLGHALRANPKAVPWIDLLTTLLPLILQILQVLFPKPAPTPTT
jgi:hypothetical protein